MKPLFLMLLLCATRASAALDAKLLEKIVGVVPSEKAGELKVSIPQKDLDVWVDGFHIIPPMGLTSWVAFTQHAESAMAMGDLVLLEDEIAPVQRAALKEGLTVTALHNHFLRDKPKVMFMHVGGMGMLYRLATSVRAVLDEVKRLRAEKGLTSVTGPVESALDTKALEGLIGHPGKLQDGVFKITLGRPDVVLKDMGAPVSSFLGFNTWMAFQGSGEKAAVAGDFAMLESEVAGVIRALVEHGLEVAAVHNHMVSEKPRIFFLHFWGVAPAADLAKGLRAALDRTGKH